MKYSRHNKILELIDKYEIETQDELADLLSKNDFKVTQATISRDIKELKLIKVQGKNGKYKYAYVKQQDNSISERFIKIFKDTLISINSSNNIVVIKTLTGSANAACAALDALNIDNILGTIAGDDTIFIVIDEKSNVDNFVDNINNLIEK